MNTPRLSGLIAATFTPMLPDGGLNLPLIKPIVDKLVEDGVRGLYVCGSTGEGPCLSVSERKAVLEAHVAASGQRLPVVAQVGHDSLVEARELAQHAAECGADAISAVPPYYFKAATMNDLVACVDQVAAAAPDLPFYYYHIPRLTGVAINVVELAAAARERIPSFTGVKYSAMTLDELQELSANGCEVLFGVDECLLSGLISGASGAVGTTYNFAMPLFQHVISAYGNGEMQAAAAAQADAGRLIRRILRHGSLPALKATMSLIGLDCGPCRLPQRALTVDETTSLRRDLLELGSLPLTATATR